MALNLLKFTKCACGLHTSSSLSAKPSHFMKKIMKGPSKRKPIYEAVPTLPTAASFSKGSQEGQYSSNSKRARVLNKLFMKHITELMANGENSAEFLGHGIEINRVQVTSDYKGLNVFWVAKGDTTDQTTERILKKNAGFLRHELSGLRLMGDIPIIQFVKDKQYAQIVEVDLRLAEADFGEDYVPVEMATKLKTKLEIVSPLPEEVRSRIQQLEELEEQEEEEVLPEMPQDVLGLNHADILNRISQAMKKSAAVHRLEPEKRIQLDGINENPIEYASSSEQRAAFKDFLVKRERLRSKLKRPEKNYIPDVEYMREEFNERQRAFFDNMDSFEYEEEDFLEENERVEK